MAGAARQEQEELQQEQEWSFRDEWSAHAAAAAVPIAAATTDDGVAVQLRRLRALVCSVDVVGWL